MAPIYESDLAEERFAKGEWNHYELWEKVEVRLRRHKRAWIAGTVLVFLALSSVPTVLDQRPKWASLGAVRKLGQEINQIKREAAMSRSAYRLVFAGSGSLRYTVEKLGNCQAASGTPMRSDTLGGSSGPEASLVLLTSSQGQALGLPGLQESFCYDPLLGSNGISDGLTGFGIIPVGDLTGGREDRLSVLVLNGASGEASFE